MSCTHLSNCELFAQFAENPALNVWKIHYCCGEFQSCIRYRQALVGIIIPLTLLPNGETIKTARSEEEMGCGALFNAIQKNRPWMVSTLIEKAGVDVNATNVAGLTALMLAAEMGNATIMHVLLDHHASAALSNINGETALDIAQRMGHQNIVALLSNQVKQTPDNFRPTVSH